MRDLDVDEIVAELRMQRAEAAVESDWSDVPDDVKGYWSALHYTESHRTRAQTIFGAATVWFMPDGPVYWTTDTYQRRGEH